MGYHVDYWPARALGNCRPCHSALIENDVVLDVRERDEEAQPGDDALSGAEGEGIKGSIYQHRRALDVGLLADECGLLDQVLEGETQSGLVREQDQGSLSRLLNRQEWRGAFDYTGAECLPVGAPNAVFRIQGVEDTHDLRRDAGKPRGQRGGSRVEQLGELVSNRLFGGGRCGSLAEEFGRENDAVVNFELEALRRFR